MTLANKLTVGVYHRGDPYVNSWAFPCPWCKQEWHWHGGGGGDAPSHFAVSHCQSLDAPPGYKLQAGGVSRESDGLWCFYSGLQSQDQYYGPLNAYWEVDGDPISDDYHFTRSAGDILEEWLGWCSQRHPTGLVPIYWYVDGMCKVEVLPRAPHTVLDHDFLSWYTWPRANSMPIRWTQLPVVDKLWRKGDARKGGFIQEATGWKPGIYQPFLNISDLVWKPGEIIIPTQEKIMEAHVRLYEQDGETALVTDAADERSFLDAAAIALAETCKNSNGDGGIAVRPYLSQILDVGCKLRGYKSPNVHEKRLLTVGGGILDERALRIEASSNGGIVTEATE